MRWHDPCTDRWAADLLTGQLELMKVNESVGLVISADEMKRARKYKGC